jgi:hypothetical protein
LVIVKRGVYRCSCLSTCPTAVSVAIYMVILSLTRNMDVAFLALLCPCPSDTIFTRY